MRDRARKNTLVYMRHLVIFTLALGLTMPASAVPVFLKPESRFATGNQARSKLESRTRKIQDQRWFKVKTKDRITGWIAEDHALTALNLVEQATLKTDVSSRLAPDLTASSARPLLAAKTPLLILELRGSWARCQPLTETDQSEAWIETENLQPSFLPNVVQRAFIYQPTSLRIEADARSRRLMTLDEGTYVQLIREKGSFLEVRSDRYQGFIPKADAWTAHDLGEKGVRAGVSLAPLRSEPRPYANLIRTLSFSTTLTKVSEEKLRWGLASTREQGDVWWPMADSALIEVASLEKQEPTSTLSKTMTTAQLFARKIYDMATSRVKPALKFVSANGIFRTTDGRSWTQIPIFRDHDYPIAVAKNGSIFIGPYVSDDHGETFQQWIKWDELVLSLNKEKDLRAQNLKILEIHPEDSTGQHVRLSLNVGLDQPIRVATDDQGVSWHAL